MAKCESETERERAREWSYGAGVALGWRWGGAGVVMSGPQTPNPGPDTVPNTGPNTRPEPRLRTKTRDQSLDAGPNAGDGTRGCRGWVLPPSATGGRLSATGAGALAILGTGFVDVTWRALWPVGGCSPLVLGSCPGGPRFIYVGLVGAGANF
jgi:hypothetical protein